METILAIDSRHTPRDKIPSKSQRSGSLRLLELAIRGLGRLGWLSRYTVPKVLLYVDTNERSGSTGGTHNLATSFELEKEVGWGSEQRPRILLVFLELVVRRVAGFTL